MGSDQYTNVSSFSLSFSDFVFVNFFSFVFYRTSLLIKGSSSHNRICVIWNKIGVLQRETIFYAILNTKFFFICANLNLFLEEIFAILPVLCKFFKITYHLSRCLNFLKIPSPIVSISFPWRYLWASIKRIEISSGRHRRVGEGRGGHLNCFTYLRMVGTTFQ